MIEEISSSKILEIAQNRIKEKKFLNSLDGISTTEFVEINHFEDLLKAFNRFGKELLKETIIDAKKYIAKPKIDEKKTKSTDVVKNPSKSENQQEGKKKTSKK